MSEIRKSILIIKSKPNAVSTVETFLKNRDWIIRSACSPKEAIQVVLQQKPSFVILAADHPDKKILALTKIIPQALPVFMMGFVENNKAEAYRFLRELPLQYKINPPITGPAVERMVNKILKDQERGEAPAAAAGAKAPGADANSKVTVKSNGGKDDGSMTFSSDKGPLGGPSLLTGEGGSDFNGMGVTGGAGADGSSVNGGGFGGSKADSDLAASLMSQLGIEDDGSLSGGDASSGVGGAGMGTGGSTGAGSGTGLGGGLGLGSDENSKANSGEGLNFGKAAYMPKPDYGTEPKKKAPTISYLPNDPKKPNGEGASFGSTQVIDTAAADPHRDGEGSFEAGDTASKLSVGGPNGEQKAAGEVGSMGHNAQPLRGATTKSGGTVTPVSLNNVEHTAIFKSKPETRNLISRIAEEALQTTAKPGNITPVAKTKAVTELMCFIIKSTRFSGYLVCAMAKNERFQEAFTNALQNELRALFERHGEPIEDRGHLDLQIREVEMESWAQEYADFLCKSVHEGQEVAMAFFKDDNVDPQVKESARADMAAVQIADINAEEIIHFNMYLYLPTNNKYVLYTNKGSKFYDSQKKRLMDSGMAQMHIKKTELNDFRKHQIQTQLNNTVDRHNAKKKEPKAS